MIAYSWCLPERWLSNSAFSLTNDGCRKTIRDRKEDAAGALKGIRKPPFHPRGDLDQLRHIAMFGFQEEYQEPMRFSLL